MKRLFILSLMFMLALGAVACSERNDEVSFAVSSRAAEYESSETESTEVESDEVESSETESSETKTESSKTESSEENGNEREEEKEEIFGTVVGKRYVNTFVDIGFSLEDGWHFATLDQLKELNKITSDMLEDKYKEQLLKTKVFFEMYAADNRGSYVTVVFEKMDEQQKEYFTDTSKFYNPANLANYEKSMEEAGAVNFEYEVTTLKVDNRVFDGIYMNYIQNGIRMDSYEFVIIKGEYIVTCGVYTTGETDPMDIIDCFDVY